MTKQVREFKAELIEMACEKVGHRQDSRFNPWAKEVESVNTNCSNGYCFEGKFVNDGTVEVEARPAVYLVKTSSGSRKYQTEYYNVITMDTKGNLIATDIETDGSKRGWALRIRAQVIELLESLQDNEPTTLDKLAELLPNMTLDDITHTALNYYLAHVEQVHKDYA